MYDHLNDTALRSVAALDPLNLILDNLSQDHEEDCPPPRQHPDLGKRTMPLSRELWIEREDFMENPTKDFFRLSPGREVRLRCAFFVKCTGIDKDANGNITAVRCTYDPATRGGNAPDGRKVKATMHWVSCAHAYEADVTILDHLFTDPDPAGHEGKDFLEFLNHNSRIVKKGKMEPSLKDAHPGQRFQFERLAYFVCDEKQSKPGAPVFLRTTTLKDSFQKAQKKAQG